VLPAQHLEHLRELEVGHRDERQHRALLLDARVGHLDVVTGGKNPVLTRRRRLHPEGGYRGDRDDVAPRGSCIVTPADLQQNRNRGGRLPAGTKR
jgi:hypothetical protein